MGLFRRGGAKAARTPEATGPIGRKFASDRPLPDSIGILTELLVEEFPAVQPALAQWQAEDDPPAVLSAFLIPGSMQRIAYAGWERGSGCEIHLVRFDYAQLPTPPLVGAWKRRDASLRSVGSVTNWPVEYS